MTDDKLISELKRPHSPEFLLGNDGDELFAEAAARLSALTQAPAGEGVRVRFAVATDSIGNGVSILPARILTNREAVDDIKRRFRISVERDCATAGIVTATLPLPAVPEVAGRVEEGGA